MPHDAIECVLSRISITDDPLSLGMAALAGSWLHTAPIAGTTSLSFVPDDHRGRVPISEVDVTQTFVAR